MFVFVFVFVFVLVLVLVLVLLLLFLLLLLLVLVMLFLLSQKVSCFLQNSDMLPRQPRSLEMPAVAESTWMSETVLNTFLISFPEVSIN